MAFNLLTAGSKATCENRLAICRVQSKNTKLMWHAQAVLFTKKSLVKAA
jgi:hypothetical protein